MAWRGRRPAAGVAAWRGGAARVRRRRRRRRRQQRGDGVAAAARRGASGICLSYMLCLHRLMSSCLYYIYIPPASIYALLHLLYLFSSPPISSPSSSPHIARISLYRLSIYLLFFIYLLRDVNGGGGGGGNAARRRSGVRRRVAAAAGRGGSDDNSGSGDDNGGGNWRITAAAA